MTVAHKMALPTSLLLPNQASPPLVYRRVVIKAGTNVLANRGHSLDMTVLASLADQLVALRGLGAQPLLVSSGAIAAGRESLGKSVDNHTVSGNQLLAAVGQSRLMHRYEECFSASGTLVAQALLTRHDLEDRQGYLNVRNTLEGLLDRGVMPVVNENDVVNAEEISAGFGDNDHLSALVANLIDADLLLLLTDTAGLFSGDPKSDLSATLVPEVKVIDEQVMAMAASHVSKVSRGGMHAKLMAAKLATSFGVTVVIAGGTERDVICRAARGERVGTLFPTTVSRMESRKRWMLSGLAQNRGTIMVDGGAVSALLDNHTSLLPAGVRQVSGHFERGDFVIIHGPSDQQVACGIVNYADDELRVIMGEKSDKILSKLGHHFGDEVVHRNNMAVL